MLTCQVPRAMPPSSDEYICFRYLEHIYTNNQPETRVILKELTRFVQVHLLVTG